MPIIATTFSTASAAETTTPNTFTTSPLIKPESSTPSSVVFPVYLPASVPSIVPTISFNPIETTFITSESISGSSSKPKPVSQGPLHLTTEGFQTSQVVERYI